MRACHDHVDIVVSLHGYGGLQDTEQRWLTILLGGSPHPASGLAGPLRRALPDYVVIDERSRIPNEYRGAHPANPVNRTRHGGVQLELPPRVRGHSPVWEGVERSVDGFVPHTEALIAAIAGFIDDVEGAGERPASDIG